MKHRRMEAARIVPPENASVTMVRAREETEAERQARVTIERIRRAEVASRTEIEKRVTV